HPAFMQHPKIFCLNTHKNKQHKFPYISPSLYFVQNIFCSYYNLQSSLIKCLIKVFQFTEILEINKIFSVSGENTENFQNFRYLILQLFL
ncbi:hypothetical protein CBP14_10235, partial [Fischerella thermalis WC245]